MNSVWVLLIALVWFTLGYRVYGRRIAEAVGIDPERTTPAEAHNDGVDYVPARNWLVLFGHHFSSICGAGPIVGPALAVAYWGWGVSLVWVLLGAVLMGAVADFTSLFISVRSDGRSVPDIARPEISPRARLLFSWFILVALVLVIAVFAIFAANTFIQQPETVLPSFGLIPVALLIGFLMYRTSLDNTLVTVIGLALMVATLALGQVLPIELDQVGPLGAQELWIVMLLVYCFFASVAPVQVLLQPRDYLASFLLFTAITVGALSVMISAPQMHATAYRGFAPPDTAGPLWPMLFVTIACGAISGFHSLVSSGTTCKQLANEGHACRIGYGGMLTEGLVGILVIICVGAALSQSELTAALAAGGPIHAFSQGYGKLSAPVLHGYGQAFAVLALNAFILTTLDTATRIGRYLCQELLGLGNMYVATAVAVGASGALALSGQWEKLWPAFGASNQLIAALALLVGSCWLMHRGRRYLYALIPAGIMLVTTMAAFVYQAWTALHRVDAGGGPSPDWFLVALIAVLIVLGLVVFWEGVRVLATGRRDDPTTEWNRA